MKEYTLSDLQAMLASGEVTARELARMYLERIALIDQDGPRINSVIEINPAVLDEAAALDRERAEGHVRGPLHGIPLLLKDNIDTADKMTTTAGSLALEGSIAAQDSGVAARLRAAGALFLGKTNLSEWANFRSTHSVSGWSSRGGQVRNPYALDRSPCGSSSGSGAAVAANLCAAAIGTETDGSIICPSTTNGIVGIKPTLGLVSRAGIIPIAHSQDTAGPMARTVADAAALLGVLTGIDPRDELTTESEGKSYTDYTQFLDKDGLKDARIGVFRGAFGHTPAVDLLIEEALAVLRTLGAELVDIAAIGECEKAGPTELEVLYYEFKADLNAYLSGLGEGFPHSMAEVIAFNEVHKERVMPIFGQEHMLTAEAKSPLTEEAYLKALADNHRLTRAEGIDRVLQEHHLNAIVCPSGGPAWLIDHVIGDHGTDDGATSPAAVAGYPHITVPAGYVRGLPVGLSFFGTAYSEPALIRMAYAYEQASQCRQSPRFLATAVVE